MKRAYRKRLVNVVRIVSRDKKLRAFHVSLYGSLVSSGVTRCYATEARDKLAQS